MLLLISFRLNIEKTIHARLPMIKELTLSKTFASVTDHPHLPACEWVLILFVTSWLLFWLT